MSGIVDDRAAGTEPTDARVRRISWLVWAGAGLVSGAVVVGVLGAGVWMLDTAMYGSAGPDMAGLAFWAGAIGAVYGAAGGLMAGLICAGIASAVSRRQVLTRQFCRRLASGVCVAVAGGIGSWMGLWAYQENPVLDTLTWFVVPVLVATAVANLVGGWVWARTWEGHRLIDDGS